ncbi:MAG: pilus assembly protein TadG-related protein [Desulfobacteria bacterium]|nr:pilus assembly protein TadG-related protein [Thermodesulfobacteriota bacterium]
MGTGNRGQVLLIFVAALLALLGVAALGIDVGYMYTVRHELQRCTDAGALAGASAFFDGSWSDSAIRALADVRARAYASRDRVATSTLGDSGQVTVGFPAVERVRVDASRNVPLFFSRIFLGPTRTITAYSVAEASVVDTNVKGLKPWGIPYPWEDTNGNDLFDPGETVHRDCPEGVPDPSRHFCPGTRVILKIGTPQNSSRNTSTLPSLQQEPGHFFALDFDGSGASGYRQAIEGESAFPVSLGDSIALEPGNMVGPTVHGAGTLLDADPTSQWNAAAALPEGDLFHAGDGSWMNSPRVIRIPIYDPEVALSNGKTSMVVAGFAGFWIESIEHHQGTVIGRYIPMRAFGQAGPAPGPAAGPVLKTLRLVE